MHYSRVSTTTSNAYSPATAVLLNELLKGCISFIIALARTPSVPLLSPALVRRSSIGMPPRPLSWWSRLCHLSAEIFSPDCFKLSIPAILYVIQNSLQFVAISNLPVASFQVAYQMKILTTAGFSVALLGKRLSKTKWLALFFLALGVGIVQISTATGNVFPSKIHEAVGSAAAAAPRLMYVMNPIKGFAAVTAACFTSGLAGVYFEMVLKNSKADLWVRNVQLSLFSIIPAILPILFSSTPGGGISHGIFRDLLKNFGAWAWATVGIQVFGGLVTAIVIKYSDNILKGFATSLSIIISFLASVALFNFQITPFFLLGSSTVLAATLMYNQPSMREKEGPHSITSPIARSDPILGEKFSMRKSDSFGSSTQSLSNLLGLSSALSEKERLAHEEDIAMLSFASRTTSQSQFSASPYISRSASPFPSDSPTPVSLHLLQGQRRV
ncbi:hypothetical protein EW145_g3901 [Phellinidium pouzarii]|uniref:Sugar phosphate transporter domain-containing protein n=1 Tax=Phellinidium pouzarii TaxID=167371 RepID=A0A4V3XCP5_9AGAM|nr:hypothetical protein EW145_g3901 [Phellinidium pouzarii]